MSALREFLSENAAVALAVGGLAIGMGFGALVYRTNFCTMGALSDLRTFGDSRRLKAWLLAIAVATLGTQILAVTGVLAIEKSMYAAPTLNWFSHALGGLMFGTGMVLAGGCASRNLARAGGGDLRSALTLIVTGLFAYMTIGGILGPARAAIEQSTALALPAAGQHLGAMLGGRFDLDPTLAGLGAGAALALVIAAACFADRAFRSSPLNIAAGCGIGALIVTGWALTGLAFDEMSDRPVAPISLTFIRPAGDTLDWLGRYTALGLPGFGVATVIGTVLGAFIAAWTMGRFRLVAFSDTADTVRNLSGAALMGIGGVLALGCTVGQGITGASTLSVGSFITLGAIVAGGYLGLGLLERQLAAEV